MRQHKTVDHLVRMMKALGVIILDKIEEVRELNRRPLHHYRSQKERRGTNDMGNTEATEMAKEKVHMENLVARCIAFADRRGKVILESNTGLTKEYQERDLIVRFSLCLPSITRRDRKGTCFVRVQQGENFVFEATGNYLRSPYNINAITYAPGDWEKRIGG